MTLNGDKSWLVFREDYIILFYYFHTNFYFFIYAHSLGLEFMLLNNARIFSICAFNLIND